MLWQGGRLAREAHVARIAGRIGDPVLRLKFLRAVMRRSPLTAWLAQTRLRHWILWSGLLLALLIPFLMKLASGKPEPADRAPMLIRRAAAGAGEVYEAVPVWRVEQTGDSEVYSNGLRIDARFTVNTRLRLYTAFRRDGGSSINGVQRSEPAGIIYHTTESCQAPFDAQDNQVIKRLCLLYTSDAADE